LIIVGETPDDEEGVADDGVGGGVAAGSGKEGRSLGDIFAEQMAALSEEERQRLHLSLAETAQKALAPVLEEVNARLSEALAPAVESAVASVIAAWEEFAPSSLLNFELPPVFLETLARLKAYQPPNWPDDLGDAAVAREILVEDGIPLVWVPRAAVVSELLDVPDRASRIAVLLSHRAEVAQDCRDVLAEVTIPAYAGKADLARMAVEALASGHDEAAHALAVVVTESAAARAIHKKYDRVRKQVHVGDLDEVPLYDLRLRAALAPLHRFYTPWEEGRTPAPMPEALSRHVTVHSASPAHFSEANALLAVLLATSTLRALQELEEIRAEVGDPSWLPN